VKNSRGPRREMPASQELSGTRPGHLLQERK
jgi:hypothetical protein